MEDIFGTASWESSKSSDRLSAQLFAPLPSSKGKDNGPKKGKEKKKKAKGDKNVNVGMQEGKINGTSNVKVSPKKNKKLVASPDNENVKKKKHKKKKTKSVDSESQNNVPKSDNKNFEANVSENKVVNLKKKKRKRKFSGSVDDWSNVKESKYVSSSEKSNVFIVERVNQNSGKQNNENIGEGEKVYDGVKRKKKKPNRKKNKYAHLAESRQEEKLQLYGLERKEEKMEASVNVTDNNSDKKKKKRKKKKIATDGNDGDMTKPKVMKLEGNVGEMKASPDKKGKKKQKNVNGDLKRKAPSLDSSVEVEDSPDKKPKKKKKKNLKNPDAPRKSPTSQNASAIFDVDKLKEVLQKDSKTKSEKIVSEEKSQKVKQNVDASSELRHKMEEKLNAARFRYLNEQMYTQSGADSYQMMKDDPNSFRVYHQGFEAQVSKWPQNPVDRVIAYIKQKSESLVVADFGCGDAKVAGSVPNKVHSFDLVATNDHVTACDMANVPLKKNSVDIAVFCLALMGTNVVDFLCEANRVLKNSGTLLVAEVVSRFEKVGAFVRKLGKLGFALHSKDDTNKMFVWFEFKKTGAAQMTGLPDIELAPCIYKRR